MRIIGKLAVAAGAVATALLTAPAANADVHVNFVDMVGADANGVIDVTGPGGVSVVEIANPVSGLI